MFDVRQHRKRRGRNKALIQSTIDLGDDGVDAVDTVANAFENGGVAHLAMNQIGAGDAGGLIELATVAGVGDIGIKGHDFFERVQVVAEAALGGRDDGCVPGHDVIASKQDFDRV